MVLYFKFTFLRLLLVFFGPTGYVARLCWQWAQHTVLERPQSSVAPACWASQYQARWALMPQQCHGVVFSEYGWLAAVAAVCARVCWRSFCTRGGGDAADPCSDAKFNVVAVATGERRSGCDFHFEMISAAAAAGTRCSF